MSTPNSPSVLVWDGDPCENVGDLFFAACKAVDEGRAAEFLEAYRAVSQHADENLGYVIGYAGPHKRRVALWEAFELNHPMLGGRP